VSDELDPDLIDAFLHWWEGPWPIDLDSDEAGAEAFTAFRRILAAHGFAIVRRMDPDLPG
jgi:hypothetical protein